MHSAIGCAVRLELEARFADRSILRDEERDLIVGAFFRGRVHLRIHSRTGPAYGRLCMAAGATVHIEAWPEPQFCLRNRALDRLDFLEGLETHTKQLLLEVGQSEELIARAGWILAYTGIARCKQIRTDLP